HDESRGAAEGHQSALVAAELGRLSPRRDSRGGPGLQKTRSAPAGHRRHRRRRTGAQLSPLRSSAGTAPRQRRGVFRPRHRLALQRSERRRAHPQRRPRSGPDEHGRPSRPTAHADGPEGSAEAARGRAHPSVPRHLRAPSIPYSAGTGDGHDEPRRSPGARKTRERTTGSTVTLKRLHWIVTCAALVAALQMTSAQTGQPPPPPSQAPPAQTTTQPPPAGQGRQQPSFRAGVDLVSLNVTVIDGTARYITDLAAQD